VFWRILQFVQIVVSLIREAEDKFGPGKGAEKRSHVVATAARDLDALGTSLQVGSCDPGAIGSYIGQLVDGAVGLMNCFGVLPKKATPSTPDLSGAASTLFDAG
jgi:hypothetical protein